MKIEAVRGLNIASLGGEFFVDFNMPVLSNAGLFAITGPTGSGKSTLLDVICLALYGATPRLKYAQSRKQVDLEELTPQDPRNLLRKGCGEGYAEVDFTGVDQQIYRARFYCYRARKNPKGRFQSVERTLYNLTRGGEQISLSKNELQDKLDALIGLNFDQFTRAVLLAQNDFATFLKADDAEKAELLEKLTGSEIYAQISALIYRKTSESIQRYKELESQVAAYPVLNEEELAVEGEKEKQLRETIDQLNQQMQRLRDAQRWLETYTQLQSEAERQKEEETRIIKQLDENKDRQLQLDRIDATQPVKSSWLKMTTLQENQLKLEQEGREKSRSLHLLSEQSQNNGSLLTQTEKERNHLRELNDKLQPKLKEARRLDNEIRFVSNEYIQNESLIKERDQRISEIREQYSKLGKEIESQCVALSQVNDWISYHAHVEKIVPAVPALLIQLEAYTKGKEEIDPVRDAVERLRKEAFRLENSSVTQKQKLDNLLTQNDALRKEIEVKQTVLEQINPQSLRTQSEELNTRIRVQSDWFTYMSQEREHTGNLLNVTSALDQTSRERALAQRQQDSLRLQQKDIEIRLEEAEAAHRLSLSMANLSAESLRSELVKDQPCPVCGALEHPFSDHATVIRIVNELETRYNEIHSLTQTVREQLTAQTSVLSSLDQSLAKLTTEKDFLVKQSRESNQKIKQLCEEYPYLIELTTDNYDTVHAETIAQLETRQKKLADVAQKESALNQLQKELTTKEEEFRNEQKRYEDLRNQTESAKKEASETAMRYQTLKEALKERYYQLQSQLSAYFQDTEWSQSPAAFSQKLQDLSAQWNKKVTQRDELLKQQADLESRQALLAKEQEGFERENKEHILRLQELFRQLALLEQQRSDFFEGKPADEVEKQSADALQAVSDSYDALFAKKMELDKTCVALETEIKSNKEQIEESIRESEKWKQSIRDWLDSYSLHVQGTSLVWDDLERIFALSDEVIALDRNLLRSLREKQIAVQTRLITIQKNIEDHQILPGQIEGADSLRLIREIKVIEDEQSVQQQKMLEIQLTLKNHSVNLSKREHIARQIEELRRIADEWSQLNEVFGAQDGGKFRKIAMSYTLDLLLSHANHYLQLINDRYQLIRSTDMLQLNVVDTYMADEVRNVASLSGGETFIVSLALALGLSSLASNRLHIETLFIDEGFGSLDSDTLQMAMSALAALQEMGRKVGVISHVPEMNEQIYPQIRVKPVSNGLSLITVVEY